MNVIHLLIAMSAAAMAFFVANYIAARRDISTQTFTEQAQAQILEAARREARKSPAEWLRYRLMRLGYRGDLTPLLVAYGFLYLIVAIGLVNRLARAASTGWQEISTEPGAACARRRRSNLRYAVTMSGPNGSPRAHRRGRATRRLTPGGKSNTPALGVASTFNQFLNGSTTVTDGSSTSSTRRFTMAWPSWVWSSLPSPSAHVR